MKGLVTPPNKELDIAIDHKASDHVDAVAEATGTAELSHAPRSPVAIATRGFPDHIELSPVKMDHVHNTQHRAPDSPVGAPEEYHKLAHQFRRGNLDALLATCGFQRVTQQMMRQSLKAQGENGIDMHLPDAQDVSVRAYYREMFDREV
jgi:hypothetical protein